MGGIARCQRKVVLNSNCCNHRIGTPDWLSSPLKVRVDAACQLRALCIQRQYLKIGEVVKESLDTIFPPQSMEAFDDLGNSNDGNSITAKGVDVLLCPGCHLPVDALQHFGEDVRVK